MNIKNLQEIKKYRKKQKLSRKKLAIISGVSARTIDRIERNEKENPRIDTILAICNTLKIPITKLIK